VEHCRSVHGTPTVHWANRAMRFPYSAPFVQCCLAVQCTGLAVFWAGSVPIAQCNGLHSNVDSTARHDVDSTRTVGGGVTVPCADVAMYRLCSASNAHCAERTVYCARWRGAPNWQRNVTVEYSAPAAQDAVCTGRSSECNKVADSASHWPNRLHQRRTPNTWKTWRRFAPEPATLSAASRTTSVARGTLRCRPRSELCLPAVSIPCLQMCFRRGPVSLACAGWHLSRRGPRRRTDCGSEPGPRQPAGARRVGVLVDEPGDPSPTRCAPGAPGRIFRRTQEDALQVRSLPHASPRAVHATGVDLGAC
jgi:hypothetical protein